MVMQMRVLLMLAEGVAAAVAFTAACLVDGELFATSILFQVNAMVETQGAPHQQLWPQRGEGKRQLRVILLTCSPVPVTGFIPSLCGIHPEGLLTTKRLIRHRDTETSEQ